jgi:hypothetical protein
MKNMRLSALQYKIRLPHWFVDGANREMNLYRCLMLIIDYNEDHANKFVPGLRKEFINLSGANFTKMKVLPMLKASESKSLHGSTWV